MQAARRDGALQSWSLDLIQNLPGQTFDHWDDQLSQAIATQAPHLSVYDLSVEPGTVFARRAERAELNLPEEDLAVRLMAHQRAVGSGWVEPLRDFQPRPTWAPHATTASLEWCRLVGVRDGCHVGCRGNAWRPEPGRPIAAGWRSHSRLGPGPDASSTSFCSWDCDVARVVLPIKQGEALEERWTTFLEQGLLQKRSGRWQLRIRGMALSNRVLLEVVLWWESVQQPTSVELHKQLPPRNQGRAEGWLPLRQAQQVSGDTDLAIAVVSGTDADHRDLKTMTHHPRQGRWDMLQHERKATGLLEGT